MVIEVVSQAGLSEALGEEKQGTSLLEQFDRELDGLLLSRGVDLTKR